MSFVQVVIGFESLDIWCGKSINIICFRTKEKYKETF